MINTRAAARILVYTASASLGCFAQSSYAGDYVSPTDDHVRVSLGVQYMSSATNIRADSSEGVAGTDIDAESEFGLKKSGIAPKFEAVVRADTRNRFIFDYFTLDRSGDAVLAGNTLAFRNVVFLPGDPLQTQLNLRTFGIAYAYSFWHTERLEIGASLGVHITDISAIVKVETQTRHIIQTEDEAGPVPTLGLNATWVASKRFYFDGRAQYLSAHVDNLDGSLGIYEADAVYRFRPNVSFAMGYTYIKAHLASTQSAQSGLFDFNTKGPELFFRIAF